MHIELFEVLPFVVIIVVAIVIWLVAAYSFLNMLLHVRGGNWFKLMFQYGWWSKNNISNYIDPPGIPHYRRLIRAVIYFLAAVGCGFVYVVFQLVLKS
jgi:hypothetical protein